MKLFAVKFKVHNSVYGRAVSYEILSASRKKLKEVVLEKLKLACLGNRLEEKWQEIEMTIEKVKTKLIIVEEILSN